MTDGTDDSSVDDAFSSDEALDDFDDEKGLLEQLTIRKRMTRFTTSLTAEVGWLKEWTLDMAIREFLQNMLDYVQKIHGGTVSFDLIQDFDEISAPSFAAPLRPFRVLNAGDRTVFRAQIQGMTVGHLLLGPGLVIFLQKKTTLFEHHLFQRSSKFNQMNQAGTHGCGMKEAALFLLNKKARLKMWMPAAEICDQHPGDSWTFSLDARSRMYITGTKLKTYTTRDLVISITGISEKWHFNPWDYIPFAPPSKVINAPVRGNCGVKSYNILLDESYEGKFYNYGIKVEENPILKDFKFGINGEFKLRDRFRKTVDDATARIAVAVKSALWNNPKAMFPVLLNAKRSLRWIKSQSPHRHEDLHDITSLGKLLTRAVKKCHNLKSGEKVILAGPAWDEDQKSVFSQLDYIVIDLQDDYVGYDFQDKLGAYLESIASSCEIIHRLPSEKEQKAFEAMHTMHQFQFLKWMDAPINAPPVVIVLAIKSVFITGQNLHQREGILQEVVQRLVDRCPSLAKELLCEACALFQFDKGANVFSDEGAEAGSDEGAEAGSDEEFKVRSHKGTTKQAAECLTTMKDVFQKLCDHDPLFAKKLLKEVNVAIEEEDSSCSSASSKRPRKEISI